MPKVDTPDIKFGFWVTIGVFLALVVLAVLATLYQRAKSKA